ncbi:RraA family protein [Paracoccus laeviglucosivorans]|uniref:Putative 4-hydroxy-4-methyl-2-oxoglutarate aldolase n=1 Tax=Paracoccus laeviglucosivorans TaxID=1197861 RepID=A0A521FJI0_9RHOB|nr:RraA family protein [Paracoccus laeviglucosivorans]SMO96363.1 Regulator of RNase E activity RraA [Paracoccus laeviglucosivorans]
MIRHPRANAAAIDPTILNEMRSIQPASLGHYLTSGIVSPQIRPLTGGKLLGRAVTLRQPLPDAIPVHLLLDDLRPGDVLVIDRAGDHHIACVGGMVARAALAAGAAGIVVDGVVTDIEELRDLGLPVYARGLNVVTTRVLDVPGAELFGPVLIGDVIVRPGDLLFGDANGLLSLDPANPDMAALVQRAAADEAREVEWRKRLAAGESLAKLNGSDKYRSAS